MVLQQDVPITPKFCQAPSLASWLTSKAPINTLSCPSVPDHLTPLFLITETSSLFPAASSNVQDKVPPSSWIGPEPNVPSYQVFTSYFLSMQTTFCPERGEQLAVW